MCNDESDEKGQTRSTLLPGEEQTARLVRSLLKGKAVGDSVYLPGKQMGEANPLEWFVYSAISEVYEDDKDWKRECLDGLYPELMTKRGKREIEIFGLCILMTDQTLVLVHLRLQIAPQKDEVNWFECRLGERGRSGLVRTPYRSLSKAVKRIYSVGGNPDAIDWFYAVTFGERE